ncbi:MAG TPA: extracellular solute-binding protein [Anaeromyxobacter sp.]|nr:extracellular solute-binding protein [Anaeromyxobacter sp.]
MRREGRLSPGRRPAAALAAVLAAALAGCPSNREYTDPDALVVATYANFTEQTVALVSRWRARNPGTKVAFVSLQPGDFQQAMYPRLLTGAHVPDVLVVDAGYLARFGAGDLLEELSGSETAAAVRDLPAGAVAQGTVNGRLVGVAAELAPVTLFYRKDVLERAGVGEAELTASWESFVAACGKVRSTTGAFCLSSEAELLEWALRAGLPSGASPYVSAEGAPYPDGARVTRALALARAAAAAGIASRAPAGSDGWRELLRQGRIAVQGGGPTMARRLQRADPGGRGAWRSAPLPEGAAVSAPSAFCALSARGARKKLAWDLLRGSCLDPAAQVTAWEEAGALPALRSAAADPRVEVPVPALGGQAAGPAWRAAAVLLPAVAYHRLEAAAADALLRELDRVVYRGKSLEQALADARAELARRMERGRR